MMVTNRVLVLGTDSAYYEYTIIGLRSFLLHNPGWPVLIMDVGMTPEQADSLAKIGRIVRYPREDFRGTGRHIPSAKARCMALAQFPSDDTLMLYLDGDSVTMDSVEPLVERFLASGKSIGIAKEDDERFFNAPVHRSWEGSDIPSEFTHRARWRDCPVLNTGVLLAVGRKAAEIGERATNLYETLKSRFQFGEQTIINSVIYEEAIDLFAIEMKYHCFVHERYLEKTGHPYVDPVYLDGERIVLRHFCHSNKESLDAVRADLLSYYGAKPVDGRAAPARRLLCVCPGGYFDNLDNTATFSRAVIEAMGRQGMTVEVLCGPTLDRSEEIEPKRWFSERGVLPNGEADGVVEGAHAADRNEEPPCLHLNVRGVPVTYPLGFSTKPHEADDHEHEAFLQQFNRIAARSMPDDVLVCGASRLAKEVLARAKARRIATAVIVERLDRFGYRDPSFAADADALIAPSQFAADYLHESLGIPCVALPPPIDHAWVRTERAAPDYLTLVDPTLENGVFVFARIADELARRRPDIRLLVVERTATVAALSANGLDLCASGNVTVVRETHDHREYWSRTRVCAVPALGWEAYPASAAEALINGIPVIGSDRGALPEILGPDGIVLSLPGRQTSVMRVSPATLDVAPWVETVIRLWDDAPFYAEQRRYALIRARRWAPSSLESEYVRVFRELRSGMKVPAPCPPPKRVKSVVLVPHLNEVEPECEQSLRALERSGVQVARRMGSSQIDVARNEMISEALHHGAESILFIDADIGFDPLDALRLLARPEPVVLGIYSKKARRELTSVFAEGVGEVTFGDDGLGVYPLRYAATGFLRIRAEVLWRMIAELKLPLCNTRWGRGVWPFFHPMVVPMGDDALHYLGEDWAFSHRLGMIGVVPVADASFRLYHWGRYGYSWEEAGGDHPRYRNYTLRF